MRRLLLTMGVFAVAAGINTASIAREQDTGWLTRRLGRGAWYAHLLLVSPAWMAFLFSLPRLDRQARWPLPDGLLIPVNPAGHSDESGHSVSEAA